MAALVGELLAWRRRERIDRIARGSARVVAVSFLGLAVACAADWFLDRDQDTPYRLRAVLTAGQFLLFAGGVYYWLVRPGVPTIDDLADEAERRVPDAGHRFVTALQLTRPSARTAGMSPELIRAVAREADELAAGYHFPGFAGGGRWKRAAVTLGMTATAVAVGLALDPGLVSALVARQALLPVGIPRPVTVTFDNPVVWPNGEGVELRFEAVGRLPADATGTIRIESDDGESHTRPLSRGWGMNFAVRLPPTAVPFQYSVRIAGGRTAAPGRVEFVPRPVVQQVSARAVLPAYVDADGKRRYERPCPLGDVTAPAGSAVVIEASMSKPVATATVVVLGRDDRGNESVAERVPMTLTPDRTAAHARSDLPARSSAYRVEVADKYGFVNITPPRRGLAVAPDRPPEGELLDETVRGPADAGPASDYDVSGMPVVAGGRIRVGYRVRSPLGIDRVFLVFRVNDGPWHALPLARTIADPARDGTFHPDLGVFDRTPPDGQVEFYPFPSPDRDREPDGLTAGGRVTLQTATLTKPDPHGVPTGLGPGDRVEAFLAAYDRNPAPAAPPEPSAAAGGRQPWRSESRVKTVVSVAGFHAWLAHRDQTRRRLRELEAAQRGVFAADEGER